MKWFKSPGRKLTTMICVGVLVLAGSAFAGATITATPSTPPNQQYTGCVERGLLFDVTIGTLPHGCPRFSTEITWNQTGPPGPSGSSNTTLYTWTVTVSGTVTNDYATTTAATSIPAGVLLTPVSATATGNISSCDDPAFSEDIAVQTTPAGAIAFWTGNTFSSTPASQTNINLVQHAGPLFAEVYCLNAATISPVTITITFTETAAPPGPAQTYS